MADPPAEVPLLENFVGGQWVRADASGTLEVPDPATGALLARVPLSSATEVERVVAAARGAAAAWGRTPVPDRVAILRRAHAEIEADREELVRGIVAEHGKTVEEAAGSLRRGIESLEFAESAPSLLQGAVLPGVATDLDVVRTREPVGVVVGITPFNFPAMIPLWMLPLALACGNTFILKPSERVPRTAERLVRAFERAGVPPGVLGLVHGGAETVDHLLAHPGVNAVAFVGSAPVARHVFSVAAAAGKRVLALAGAKNHLVVLPDADLDRAVRAILSSAYGSAGERCLAGSVVVAVEPVGDALVARLSDAVRSLRVGPGSDPKSEMGPLIRAEHRARVAEFVAEGVREGAVLAAEGTAPSSGGFFLRPVLLDRVRPEMRVAREEIFGPVLVVLRAGSLDEAIDLANQSPYGNASAIFTQNGASAARFRRRIEAGMVGVNLGVPAPPAYFPFVGWKGSVYGDLAVTGPEAVQFYTRPKTVLTRWG